jgi:hypothetical protein
MIKIGDIMILKSENTKIKHKMLLNIIISLLITSSVIVIADDENSENLKITMTKMDMPIEYQREMQYLPISIEMVENISTLEHVDEVLPIVYKMYRSFPNNRSFLDGDFTPNPDERLSEFNRPFSREDMMNQMADFIVEGIPLNQIESYISSILTIELESGRHPFLNDSAVVIIGKNAQQYFHTDLNDTITIEETDFTVLGIFENETYNNFVFMSLSDAQSLYDVESDEINMIYLYADSSSSVEQLVNTLAQAFPDFQIRSKYYDANIPSFDRFDFQRNKNDIGDDYGENSTPGFEAIILILMICFLLISKKFIKRINR